MEQTLKQKIKTSPPEPGVYLLYNKKNEVIYIGKALNIKKRLQSYLKPANTSPFPSQLRKEFHDLNIILTQNEKEALLLENTLIKKYSPRFNLLLKDDKNFILLRLSWTHPYPTFEITRQISKNQASYFGPYPSSKAAQKTLSFIIKHFGLRRCKASALSKRQRPCLWYQMQRCLAPCCLKVDNKEYLKRLKQACLFLQGRYKRLLKRLEQEMKQKADKLEFEAARIIRDRISAIQKTIQSQMVVSLKPTNQDVIEIHAESNLLAIAVMRIREGRLIDCKTFSFSPLNIPEEEILSSFLIQYYEKITDLPSEIILGQKIKEKEAIQSFFESQGKKTKITSSPRGSKAELLKIAKKNVLNLISNLKKQRDSINSNLKQIQALFKLEKIPQRIECIDVSSLAGYQATGSMAVMIQGKIAKDYERRFKIKTTSSDDYKMIYEVLKRRLKRGMANEKGWELPDLLVIDGGRGHLKVAETVLRDLSIKGITPIALAKEQIKDKRQERVFVPNLKTPLNLSSYPATRILLALRDRAHEIAHKYHQLLRKKRQKSLLEQIRGIGPKTTKLLLNTMKDIKKIKTASFEELKMIKGISLNQAKAIYQFFREQKNDN